MNRTLVAVLVVAALAAVESEAQRIEIGAGGFQALAQTQFAWPSLVLMTSGQSGGTHRCLDRVHQQGRLMTIHPTGAETVEGRRRSVGGNDQ